MSDKKIKEGNLIAFSNSTLEKTPDDVKEAIEGLKKLVEGEQLIGLSVVAITSKGYVADYFGSCIEQPERTIGILERLKAVLVKQAERIH